MASWLKDFQRLAGKAVHQFQMIENGDSVLVGLSGGKDSLAMLRFLDERRSRVPIEYRLVAAHLDLGYDDPGQQTALKEYVAQLDVPSYFETTDYAPKAHSDFNRENPCFLCSRLRRQRLFELARDHDCNKVALGHNRDDLNETLLLNIFYSGEISTMKPVQEFFGGLLTVIRPLCMVPEEKIQKVTRLWNLPIVENGCPSNGITKRGKIKEIINNLSGTNNKVKGNIFRSLSNYRPDYLLPPSSKYYRAKAGGKPEDQGHPVRLREKEPLGMEEQHRKRTRVEFKASVDIQSETTSLTGLASKNLSLKGLFVETTDPMPEGTEVKVRLRLSGNTSQVILAMKGTVVRAQDDGMAVEFSEVDLDSFFHLRNIVLYNTQDPAEIDEELAKIPAF